MGINLDTVGQTSGPFKAPYASRDAMLYALAVGADEHELPFLYERHGPLVVLSFAVVPSFRATLGILDALGVAGKPIVHGEHRLRLARSERDMHVDPEGARQAGFERPLIHGLCTLGYLARAATRAATGGDPSRLVGSRARFAAPVYPGQGLVAEFRRHDGGLVAQMTNEAGTVVLSNAAVDLV